ncbi:Heat-inducible transcription repressor HrcA|uniref:heat-inducible transcriptional repressor HrcA n=1 Tax=Neochlamydia sp. AcF84 TaxID=2315858 RepID=UPI0014098A56|nr:heat-inducible transcriptional repressor HrcA [Neochlamydia sp. AcF84]NGY95547.1 Heat-inducible transcription repressor HrcA [Neochlamydia sp. AcF84]
MKALKLITVKKSAKHNRERQVLMGLIELYLKTGKPIGSHTLKEFRFEELSSATIRNYFSNLEKEGYLSQQHSSGGRIPTTQAFRLYAQEHSTTKQTSEAYQHELQKLRDKETHELASYLQEAAETLSHLAKCAVFLSAPRFDQDYINQIKIVEIDHTRCLCIILTSIGLIQTEIMPLDKRMSTFSLKRMERYFQWRLNRIHQSSSSIDINTPDNLTEEEKNLAQLFYNEIMVRYIVSYSNFTDEDIYRTGFSKLLAYPEMQDVSKLTHCLSLFENVPSMRLLLKECSKKETLKFWIGEDLDFLSAGPQECSVVTVPYYANKQCVGAIGLLGPIRLPYRHLFGLLHNFSENISEAITRSIYKFKITFRQPQRGTISTQPDKPCFLGESSLMLIEHNGT